MSSNLLTGGIAATIGKAMAFLFRDATLERDTISITSPPASPDVDVADWAPSVTTTTSFSCKAIFEDYSDYFRATNMVEANDRKILVLATSLSTVPVPGDRIILDGLTYDVCNPVKTDPAKAVWVIQGRQGEV